jgi:hypothetical protein
VLPEMIGDWLRDRGIIGKLTEDDPSVLRRGLEKYITGLLTRENTDSEGVRE